MDTKTKDVRLSNLNSELEMLFRRDRRFVEMIILNAADAAGLTEKILMALPDEDDDPTRGRLSLSTQLFDELIPIVENAEFIVAEEVEEDEDEQNE